MIHLWKQYLDAFRGLSAEVWWLALVALINRAGSMVIPFLSLYLTESMNFSLTQTGWILTCFGVGSLAGSWLGGKLTDIIGHYKVMVLSLMISAVFFVLLQFLSGFTAICIGVFFVMVAADLFRPAVFVALSAYSKPENRTRSVTLIRLAINLGFSVGPALGGLIITSLGYGGLFWVDGITCAAAGVLLLMVLSPKKRPSADIGVPDKPLSVYKDRPFLIFLLSMVLFGFCFLQYFSTIPLFYKTVHKLSEDEIGLVMAMNGFLIFVLEMPLIKYFEHRKWSALQLIIGGIALLMLSFAVLNVSIWVGWIIIGMLFMTLGEMLAFPFSNAMALNRSRKGLQGEYMALYTIAFSFGHIFGHNGGMQLVERAGFTHTWWVMSGMGMVSILLLLWSGKKLRETEV